MTSNLHDQDVHSLFDASLLIIYLPSSRACLISWTRLRVYRPLWVGACGYVNSCEHMCNVHELPKLEAHGFVLLSFIAFASPRTTPWPSESTMSASWFFSRTLSAASSRLTRAQGLQGTLNGIWGFLSFSHRNLGTIFLRCKVLGVERCAEMKLNASIWIQNRVLRVLYTFRYREPSKPLFHQNRRN